MLAKRRSGRDMRNASTATVSTMMAIVATIWLTRWMGKKGVASSILAIAAKSRRKSAKSPYRNAAKSDVTIAVRVIAAALKGRSLERAILIGHMEWISRLVD